MIFKKLNETGRSMVEMLGVLAMIGVLSLVGLWGYNAALKKHQQNELKYAATTRAIAVSSQMLAGHVPDKLEDLNFDKMVQGYEMRLSSAPNGSALMIEDEEGGESKPFYDWPLESADEEFALVIEGEFPYDLLRFFLEWAASSGAVQRVMYNKGQLTLDNLDELYSTLGDTSASESTSEGASSNGTRKIVIYLIYKSDLALKDGKELKKELGHSSSEYSLCGENGDFDAIEGGESGCICDPGYYGPKCEEKYEFCNEHGVYFHGNVSAKICLCDEGWSGSYCEHGTAFSPCQTYEAKDGENVRGFKAKGTACEQAGVSGQCDTFGNCIPKNAKACSDINACGQGEFCNYCGKEKGCDNRSPNFDAPNVCEKVNPESFEYENKIYYHNSDKDLRSWCRAANRRTDCTYGFLSYYGAQSWCKSLGAELVDANFIKSNCEEFKEHLPQVLGDQQYWVAGQSVVHLGNNCEIQKMSRTDGYAAAAGVVCVGEVQKPCDGFTDKDGNCRTCDDQASYPASDCGSCPNREMVNGTCALSACQTGKFESLLGSRCCDDVSTSAILGDNGIKECGKCQEREVVSSGSFSYCALKVCPEGYTKNESDGDCVPGDNSCKDGTQEGCDGGQWCRGGNECVACLNNSHCGDGICVDGKCSTCPNGGTPSTSGMYCCKNGKIQDETGAYSMEDTSECCPSDTVALCDGECCNQKCNSNGKCPCPSRSFNPLDASGPRYNCCVGENDFFNGERPIAFNLRVGSENTTMCCPEGTVAACNPDKDSSANAECCNRECDAQGKCPSCPNGGTPSTTGMYCCKDGKVWEGDDAGTYSGGDIPECGCPKGTVLSSDGMFCCKGNQFWDPMQDSYAYGNALCGCSNGGTPSPSGYACCKNGKMQDETGAYSMEDISECCPSGTVALCDGTCCNQECGSDGKCVSAGSLTESEKTILDNMKENYNILKDFEGTEEYLSTEYASIVEILLNIKASATRINGLDLNPSSPEYLESVQALREEINKMVQNDWWGKLENFNNKNN